MAADSSSRSPITDSPWFWGYLFASAGLIALVLATNKFGPRQAEIERKTQGRQRAIQQSQDQTPTVRMSDEENTVVTLQPLYWLLGGVLAVAWVSLWWTRFRSPSPAAESEEPEQ